MEKLFLKKGDKVEVIVGKDRGKQGKVLRVVPSKNKVVVEGVAKVKKNVKPTQKSPQPGRIEVETGIHKSNVMIVCSSCGQKTRVGFRMEDDKKVRFCKRCEQLIEVTK
jgi:large subunit ribosomal protein L24